MADVQEKQEKIEWEKELAEMAEDSQWNAMKHQVAKDANDMQKMRTFYAEAGLDADGNPYVLERGWAEDDHVLPVEPVEVARKYQCPECNQQSDTEHA